MKCPRCKKQLRKGAKFCPACGTRIEKKRGIRFTSILLVIAILLGIVTIGWGSGILIAKYFGGNFKDLFSPKNSVEIHNVEEAIAHARNLGKEYGYENALSELTEKVTTTIDGDSYYRLQQNYQGIPVYGRNIVYATDSNGVTTSISGNAFDVDGIEQIVPSILEHQIIETVAAYHKDVLGIDTGNLDFNIQNDAKLYIYNLDEKESHLAYCIYVGGYEYLVDAHSAEILLVNCLIRFAEVTGDLEGQIKRHENITYTQENNVYSLVDSSRNISAYTADNEYKWLQAKWVQKSENLVVWNSGETVDSSAVDAFVNVQTAYDYFDKVLQNKSIDGSGKKQIKVITGVLDLQDNACFSLAQEVINFGNANRYNYDKSAYIDWVAHEYMHGVEHNHSGMIYQGESGAVMEALSDIFGELVEGWSKKEEPNWIFTETQRNMKNPASQNYPAAYHDEHWADSNDLEDDNGGVHTNNTVISHAAYLMWNGGINENADKKISTEQLAKLWYRAMLMMPADCDFTTCRQMVEWAALAVDGITDEQRACIAEAFDMVGIEDVTLPPEILVDCDRNVLPNSVLNVYNVEGKLHPRYTLNITGTVAERELAYASNILSDIGYRYETTEEITKAKSYHLDLPDGYYTFNITDSNNPKYSYTFTVSVSEQGTDNIIELHTDFEDKLVVKVTDSPKSNAYEAYISAVNKTIATGNWSEHLVMTANMAITDGSAKTKTKVTLTSNANVSDYSESNPSQIRMSGSAEMTVMGQTYAWDMEYENGTAHYRYTKPNQTSADMKIDPSFFNFGTMTSDMMTDAKLSGNKITFTVPGEKIAEVGIAAVNQMSGVDNLEYGDVDVTVTISDEGKIDNIVMVFHASLEYQGYDAYVDYNIDYRFSDSTNISSKPASSGVPIVPGIYAQDGADYNTLTVHETDGRTLEFTAFWYRIGDLSNVAAAVDDNIASFEFFTPNAKMHVFGTLHSPTDNALVLNISESTHEYVDPGEYRYSLVGKIFSDAELKAISAALNVPADLDTKITQGEPGYWEGGGIYRTPIEIYCNGELIAGASVNSLTGELAGSIYTYSGHSEMSSICASGNCGKSLNWELRNDGLLTITGSGEMTNYYLEGDDDDMRPPWLHEDIKVTNIVFNGNITSIGNNAFCFTSIKDITIPASVSEIYYSALKYIDTLEQIYVESGNTVFASDDSGVLFNKDKTSLITAPAKLSGTYTVPTSVTWIYDNAFSGCSGLKTINWPDSVNTIGQGAFSGCTSLEYVCIPSSVTRIDHYTFNSCVNLSGIRISENITSIGYLAFGNCNLKDVFYGGTEIQWQQLMKNCQDDNLRNAYVYYQSY